MFLPTLLTASVIQQKHSTRGRGQLARSKDYAPIIGDDEAFNPTPLLTIAPCILWGGNYFTEHLPVSNSWLVWDKRVREGVGVNDQADGELAWSNATKGVRIFRHMWNGMWRDSERGEAYHPAQKPVALMSWCLKKANLQPGSLVFDPFMGSGPVALAARKAGLRYIGCDVSEAYCETTAKRLEQTVFAFSEEEALGKSTLDTL